MTQSQEQTQLSNKEYWSSKYPIEALPQPVDPRNRSLRNFFRRYHHKEFSRWLKRLDIKPGAKLIEIGGGGSIWLPYFGAEHGLDVTALDYSETGCAAAEYTLQRSGVEGHVVCADLFAPPEELKESFDILTSFGVVEHFTDTAHCLEACSRFLRPGGVMMTVIPNLAGLNGAGTRFFSPETYAIHVPMSAKALRQAHEKAGLEVLECRYFTPFWISDWSVPAQDKRPHRRLLRNLLWYPSAAAAAATWVVDDLIGNRIPGSRLLSPWSICWSRKPPAEPENSPSGG